MKGEGEKAGERIPMEEELPRGMYMRTMFGYTT